MTELCEQLYPFEAYYGFEKKDNGLMIFTNPTEDNKYLIKYMAYGPTFEIISNALNECMYINHITGESMHITNIFYKSIFTNAVVHVQFPDNPELNEFNVANINCNKKHYGLIKIIAKSWYKDAL